MGGLGLHLHRRGPVVGRLEVSDWLLAVILLTAIGTGCYLVGHARGRQQGWRDRQEYSPECSCPECPQSAGA